MFVTTKDLQRVEQAVADNTASVKEMLSTFGVHLSSLIDQVNLNTKVTQNFFQGSQAQLQNVQDLTRAVQDFTKLTQNLEEGRAALEEMISATMDHVTQLHATGEDLSNRMAVLASKTQRELDSLKKPLPETVTTTTLPPKDLPAWISVHQIRKTHVKDTGSTATNRQIGGLIGAIARQQNLKTVESYRETPAIVHGTDGEKHQGIAQYYSLDASEIILRELRKRDKHIPKKDLTTPEEAPTPEPVKLEQLPLIETPVELDGYKPLKFNPILDWIFVEYDLRVANNRPRIISVESSADLCSKVGLKHCSGSRFIQDAKRRGAVRIDAKRGSWSIEVLKR